MKLFTIDGRAAGIQLEQHPSSSMRPHASANGLLIGVTADRTTKLILKHSAYQPAARQ